MHPISPSLKLMITIGKNIKGLRKKMNWSQAMTASKLQMTIPVYSNLENGKTDISLSRLCKIAELFKVSILDIIYEANEHPLMLLTDELSQLKEVIYLKNKQINALQSKLIKFLDI